MKIEKLKFKNINSLAGEFEIDFTHPELATAGIFCITGPTGSGKSTILDAICFALYRETPRGDKITASHDDIMSKGEAECYAELTFSHKGERYFVKSRHTRNQNTGALGEPTQILSKQNPDGTYNPICNNKSEAVAKIEKLIGMNFTNFTRCALLAQGEFALFLKASGTERADLLSKITGAADYDKISGYVIGQIKELEQQINSLPPITVLDNAERAEKAAGLNQLNTDIKADKEAVDSITATKNWRKQYKNATNEVQKAENNETIQKNKLSELQKNGAEENLRKAAAAREVKPLYDNVNKADKEAKDSERALVRRQQEYDKVEKKAEVAQRAVDDNKPICDESINKYQAERKLIDTEMRAEEVQLNNLDKSLQDKRAEHEHAVSERDAKQNVCNDTEIQISDKNEVLNAAKEYLNAHPNDNIEAATLVLAKTRLLDWKNATPQDTPLPSLNDLKEEQKNEETAISTLLENRTQEDWKTTSTNLNAIKDAHLSYLDAANDFNKKATLRTVANQEKEELDSIDAAEEQLKKATNKVQVCKEMLDLEGKLCQIYLELKAGKLDSCPCCGSTQYGERHVMSNSELKQAQDDEANAKTALEKLKKQHEVANKNFMKAEADFLAAKRAKEDAEAKRKSALNICGLEHVPENLQELINAIQQKLADLEAHQQKLKKVNERINIAEKREAFYQALEACSAAKPQQISDAVELVSALKAKQERYEKNKNAVETCEQEIAILQARQTAEASALAEAIGKVTALENSVQEIDKTMQMQKAAFVQKWDTNESAADLVKQIDSDIEQIKVQHRALVDKAVQANNERNLALTNLENARNNATKANKAAEQAKVDFLAKLAEKNFATVAEFEQALLLVQEENALRTQLEKLKADIQTAEALSKREKEELEKLEQSKPEQYANASDEEIEQLLTALRQTIIDKEKEAKKLDFELQTDDSKRAELEEQKKKKIPLENEAKLWKELYAIMGGKSESFKQFAQQITLDILLKHANRELAKLTSRFEIVRTGNDKGLELSVIDYEQDADTPRTCANLSGGETFIVSLALALGLAHMASDTRIDTLFMDEGFGTLDHDTLRNVLASLDSLRAEGKMIGLISHVAELSEQIYNKLEVEPFGGGFSTIAAHPAIKAAPKCRQ